MARKLHLLLACLAVCVGASSINSPRQRQSLLRAASRGSKLEKEEAVKVSSDVEGDAAGEPSSKSKNKHFRAVSCTLWCVMTLTIVSLVVHTGLAISRNIDDMAPPEAKARSMATEVLTTAARSGVYPPMMCMLFVGCRMFVLATTEGLGEPPLWVKACMVASTSGMVLQFLMALLMPLVANPIDRESFTHTLAGEDTDVHPFYHYTTGCTRVLVYIMQGLVAVAIYGGVVGVVVGIITYPEGTTKVSPAVICMVCMSVMYFTTHGILMIIRGYMESSPYNFTPTTTRLCNAALAATLVVRKAPMFAVIFLAARMRALNLDPPLGMPPKWAQACFFTITASLLLETLAAFCAGLTGVKSAGYYGEASFKAHAGVHIAELVFSGVQYALLAPVVSAVYAMKFANGDEAPLSSMMKCVLVLSALYFGIRILKWITVLRQSVLGIPSKTLQDTVAAASVSVNFAPLVCILFVAARMRALQITQQKGHPQGWAQDAMYMCVFATCLQCVCCLLLPIFTPDVQADEDGNASFDMQPLIGALAVTGVKYIAFFFLHGGVITICFSVFMITPETAHTGKRVLDGGDALVEALVLTLVVCLLALLFSSAKVVGLAVKLAIESVDTALLGVQIEIGKAAIDLARGYVCILNLVVNNPTSPEFPELEDHTWASRDLLNIGHMEVKVNIWKLITSLGKEFEVEYIELRGVDVNLDVYFSKGSYMPKSNVTHIVNHLEELGKKLGLPDPSAAPAAPAKPPPEAAAAAAVTAAAAAKAAADKKKAQPKPVAPPPKPAAPPPDVNVVVKDVHVNEIGAAIMAVGVNMRLRIGGIDMNVQEEFQAKGMKMVAPEIIKFVMKTVFATVSANKDVVAKVTSAAGGAVMAGFGKAFKRSASDADEEEDDEEDDEESEPEVPKAAESAV